jgi:septal ring factor EnvC (AmiA/AmiB activator)
MLRDRFNHQEMTMTDPTRTYTKLAPDTVFPFDQIEQFKSWHDAAMAAMRIKDQRIQDLESRLKQLEANNEDSSARGLFLLEDLKVASEQIERLTKELAELQRQSAELQRNLLMPYPTAPFPWPQPWISHNTGPGHQ